MDYSSPADEKTIEQTIKALKLNNIEALVVENKKEALEKVMSLLPKGAEVMTMSSETLHQTGILDEINSSSELNVVKKKLEKMNRETQGREMQRIGAAPEYSIGSVHAVTQDGKVMVASNTGSQLPAYAYGADHVIWIVGAQKIVKDIDEGFKRIYDYVLPLESQRARKAYGSDGSNVSKLLIFNKEVKPNRITMIIVKESLGF